jgi:hypothetical protein
MTKNAGPSFYNEQYLEHYNKKLNMLEEFINHIMMPLIGAELLIPKEREQLEYIA